MDEETLEDAILRLDSAVTRAERAAAQRRPAPVAATPADADPTLPERHARLRAGTEAALARLDRLIGTDRG